MNQIALSTYSIRVKHKYLNKYHPLSNILNNYDLFELLIEYLHEINADISHHEKLQLLLTTKANLHLEGRRISGIFERGEYGYQSNIYNLESEKIEYIRKVMDAELLPFYFCFYIPDGESTRGVLILQRFGIYGIKGLVEIDLKHYIEKKLNLILEINPLAPADMMKKFLDRGRVTKIRFIKYEIPRYLDKYFDKEGKFEEIGGYVEVRYVAGRNKNMPIKGYLEQIIDQNQNPSQVIELPDYEYENLKVEVTMGDSVRTLNLLKPDKLNTSYDITNDIEYGTDGHPDFSSIDEYTKDLLLDLIEEINV